MLSKELRMQHDPSLTFLKPVTFIHKSEQHSFAISLTYERYKVIWPISDRDFIICTSVRYEPEKKRYVIAKRSGTHADYPPNVSSCVRGLTLAGYLIEEVSESSCRVFEVGYVDMAGSVPVKFWNVSISARGDGTLVAMLKILEEQKKKGFPVPVNTCGWLETMVENAMKK